MFDLEEELKKLPDNPGVYLMHDAEDHIIYVGKAVVLKNRVRQYFQAGYRRSPKIERMVSQIAWFEYIITDSETEALVLECNLIKEHRPRFNTMLTDDKAYPFIRVTVDEAFPRVLFSHRMHRDKARYFGPYPSAGSVKDVIRLLQRLYSLRTCSRSLPKDIGRERPCLNKHIGLCSAPCDGSIPQEDYAARLAEAMAFLEGDHRSVKKDLRAKMEAAAAELNFEEAAAYRELLFSIERLEETQKITDTAGEDRDIVALAAEGDEGIAQVFYVRGGKLLGRDHFHLRIAEGDDTARVLSDFLQQFYAGTPFIPHEILISELPEDADALAELLRVKAGHRVQIVQPKRGEKHKLMDLAAENAELQLKQNKEKIKREEARTIGAVRELGELLGLPDLYRLEAYDISNISGFQSVGSMVVFEQGRPKRSDYRKFRIKTVIGPNDYASLEEVILRRFSHGLEEQQALHESGMDRRYGGFSSFPDLVMMDGGKGQVHIAEGVLARLGLSVPVCGMVKDDNHRTRGLYFHDEEIPVDRHSAVFHLITRVQDEAHRFAIEFHRSLRSKEQVHSVLDDIPGIGKTRRKALMRSFPSIDALKSATFAELTAVPGMNAPAARTVYAFFHDGELPEEGGTD